MARRKKEPEGYHREQISQVAQTLFQEKGIANTTMDEIAKIAQYSKATLYVYFKNKEEIVGELTLKSMKLLKERLALAVNSNPNTKAQYLAICNELVNYQAEFPFYFEMILREINIDFKAPTSLLVEQEIFEVGEQINAEIGRMLENGSKAKVLRSELNLYETVFLFWSSLSGIILMSANKQAYIEQALHISKQQFLENGFELLYRSIQQEETL